LKKSYSSPSQNIHNDTIIISKTFQSGADFVYGDIQPFYILN